MVLAIIVELERVSTNLSSQDVCAEHYLSMAVYSMGGNDFLTVPLSSRLSS